MSEATNAVHTNANVGAGEREQVAPSASDELQKLAYMMSHDMRAPVRHIRQALAHLDRDQTAVAHPEATRLLNVAQDAATLLDRMLVGLLEYARVQTLGWPFAQVPLSVCVRDAWTQMQQRERAAGSELRMLDSLPSLTGDERQIQRLFELLFENAVRHCGRPGQQSVEVGCRQEGDTLRCWVDDNGPGLGDWGHRPYASAFEPFQRGPNAVGRPGAGVGLAICRRIMQRHQGTIRIGPRPEGDGTRVVLEFPTPSSTT